MKFFLRNHSWPHGLDDAAHTLASGRHRNDVLEAAIRPVEADPEIDSVGTGGFPNVLGVMQLDAGFMDGDGRQMGAIGALENFIHPVSVARKLMDSGLHTMLVGEDAARFAMEQGFKEENILTPEQKQRWERNVKPRLAAGQNRPLIDIVREALETPDLIRRKKNIGTVVMIASDGNGISAATSTSGWPYKHPGRLGDTPVAGAGFYADSRYGACVCTFTGEMAMRSSMARHVITLMETGKSVQDAVEIAARDLANLKGGILSTLNIHAADKNGNMRVVTVNPPLEYTVTYSFWKEGMAAPEVRPAEIIRVSHKN